MRSRLTSQQGGSIVLLMKESTKTPWDRFQEAVAKIVSTPKDSLKKPKAKPRKK
jgi:hypothetical protein